MLVRTVFINNAKLALVGVAAFALGGAGTVASVTLSGNSNPVPAASHATETEDGPETEAKDATDKEDEAKEANEAKEADETGVRPTNTRGYCVSHVVAAGHAAGKKGKDLAAAKAACPKPGKSKVSHVKSAKPPVKASTPA